MKMPKSLYGKTGVVIDTNVFIFLLEDHPKFGHIANFIIENAEQGFFQGVITPITFAEVLVKPIQKNRNDLADRCRSAFRRFQNIKSVDLSFHTGEMAGALKAKYNLPLADMLQAAIALKSDPPCMITNDKVLKRIDELEIFVFEDFIKHKNSNIR